MKEFYTVGEVAGLFNVSTDTLRYYDKMNIIKPWMTGENGYRYYSKAQFEMLSTVFMLSRIKTPLKEIRKIIRQEDTLLIEKSLDGCIGRIDSEIRELSRIRESIKLLENTVRNGCSGEDITEIIIPRLYLLLKEYDSDTDELDLGEIFAANRQTDPGWTAYAGIVSTASKEDILTGNFHKYNTYGYMSEFPCKTKRKDLLEVLENTHFVCCNVCVKTVEHSEVDSVYRKMLAYIKEKNYALSGDVIERNIFDTYGRSEKDLTIYFRIYMPVIPLS